MPRRWLWLFRSSNEPFNIARRKQEKWPHRSSAISILWPIRRYETWSSPSLHHRLLSGSRSVSAEYSARLENVPVGSSAGCPCGVCARSRLDGSRNGWRSVSRNCPMADGTSRARIQFGGSFWCCSRAKWSDLRSGCWPSGEIDEGNHRSLATARSRGTCARWLHDDVHLSSDQFRREVHSLRGKDYSPYSQSKINLPVHSTCLSSLSFSRA